MRHLIIVFFLLLALDGCRSSSDEAITDVFVSGQKAKQLNLARVNDSIVLNLSDLAEDLHFIFLETNPMCLVNRPKYYIGKKSILSFERNGSIFQFDISGQYIRTIASQGKGPEDVTMYQWAVDELNNVLYIRDEEKDHFIHFDLVSGKYLGEIPAVIPGYIIQFVVDRPGVLAVAPVLDRSVLIDRYLVYWQSVTGGFIGGIKASPDVEINSGSQVLFQFADKIRYQRPRSDTLFSIDRQNQSACWIFKLNENNPGETLEMGSKNLNIISLQKNFILCNVFVAGETHIRGRSRITGGKLFHLVINQERNTAHYVTSFIADPLGQPVRPEFLNSQPDGTLFIAFTAIELKELIAKTLSNPDIGLELKEQMKLLDNRVNENDNPVILTGKVKN